MIKPPPKVIPLSAIASEQLAAHYHYHQVIDGKGRYLPFDEFQHRLKRADIPVVAWSLTRSARDAAMMTIPWFSERQQQAGFNITPAMSQACAMVDTHTTRLALQAQHEPLRAARHFLEPLDLEEPISSSQLEGAATTTLVARKMLESGRTARTEDEQMILGNARLMAEIPHHFDEPLSVGLIRQFHAAGMQNINDQKYQPGKLRVTDDVGIPDYNGNITHQPPAAEDLEERLEAVCDWYNRVEGPYIHPLIRSCMLHFMLAHEHPFNDGNGRTARALFYWSMLRYGYDAFRFISISSLLHAAPVKYAHSCQYTESDGMDMTYFLDYQAQIVSRAIERYRGYIAEVTDRRNAVERVLLASGVIRELTSRQWALAGIVLISPGKIFTAAEISAALGVSDNTARADLRQLERVGIVNASKTNRQLTGYAAPARLSELEAALFKRRL